MNEILLKRFEKKTNDVPTISSDDVKDLLFYIRKTDRENARINKEAKNLYAEYLETRDHLFFIQEIAKLFNLGIK